MRPPTNRPYISLLSALIGLSGLTVGGAPTLAADDVIPLVTTEAGVEGQSAVAVDKAEVLRFRTEFGLPTDTATLNEAANDAAHTMEFGIPLLPAEAADLRWRDEVGSHIPPLGRTLERDFGSTFGGIYMDQAARGTVDVAFTDQPEQHRSVVQGAFPEGTVVRLRHVENTLRYLQDVQADLDARSDDFRSRGVVLLNTEVQIRTNRVEVGVSFAPDWLVSEITAKYGSEVVSVYVTSRPETTVCTSRNSCTDNIPGSTSALRAGTQLYDSGCSFAFGAIFDQSGTKGVLTAGHCADLVPAGHIYQHPNNTNMGAMLDETWAQNTSADAGFVDVADSRVTNRVYFTSSFWYSITAQQPRSEEYVGMQVCLSGRMRGEAISCGQLYAIDASPVLSGVQMYHQRTATYTTVSGDSGGAVMNAGNKAFGIQSGKLSPDYGNRAVYSHISYVLSATYGVDATLILSGP